MDTDLGFKIIADRDVTLLPDPLLRTDPARARRPLCWNWKSPAVKPFALKRLEELHSIDGQWQQPVRNACSGRVALLVPARSIPAEDGTRVSRFDKAQPHQR